MYCRNCGNEIPNGTAFCSNCGSPLNFTVNQVNQNNGVNQLKKKKNLIILVICVVAAVVLIVTGITLAIVLSNNNDSIVGSWADTDGNVRFSFYDDGTCEGGQGPYYEAAENGTITFYDSYHYPYSSVTYYEVHGNKLYLSTERDFDIDDEDTVVFYRE